MRVNDYIKRQGHTDASRTISLDDETLRKLQLTMLDILNDFATYCDAHDIEWTLGGGSVLGAVRHKGFIPWDDDIDINMTREAWKKFYPGFQAEYSDKYWLFAPNIYDKCNINAIRIYKKGTVLQELSALKEDSHGLFIDIFLIENVPNNAFARKWNGFQSMALRYICSCVRLYEQRDHYEDLFAGDTEALSGFRKRFFIGRLFSFKSAVQWVVLSDRINGKCKDGKSKFITMPTGCRYYFGELTERDSYFPPILFEFENNQLPCPKNYDLYLTKLYGDWRTIPPDNKRETHVLLALDFGDGTTVG